MSKQKLYTETSIESLSPLEFTRLRPQVYAGDCTYATQLLVEIVSNAIDEFRLGNGNLIEEDSFNANDFTTLFWLFVSVCVTVFSVFLSKLIPKEKFWFRILYIVGMLLISLLIAYRFRQMMMWC